METILLLMNPFELQQRVEQISLEFFGRPFDHLATYNKRLRRSAGRFMPDTLNLDFSVKLFAEYDQQTQDQIIKHELVHYHLFRQHRGYQHRDADFKALLAQVGGTRFAPTPASEQHQPVAPRWYYVYQCEKCGAKFPRRRRINTAKFACGRCHGHLQRVAVAKESTLLAEGLLRQVN